MRRSMWANVLFCMVLFGQSLNVLVTLFGIGDYSPAMTAEQVGAVLLVTLVAAAVQMLAIYTAARESQQQGRWMFAVIMMIVSFIGIVCYGRTDGHYITFAEFALALTFAVISCGTLIWLRRTPVAS